MVGHLCPEILVFLHMQLSSDGVADDAERDERHSVYLTGMGDGTRLHIDRQPFRETLLDGLELLTLRQKLIAGTDLPQMDGCGRRLTQ